MIKHITRSILSTALITLGAFAMPPFGSDTDEIGNLCSFASATHNVGTPDGLSPSLSDDQKDFLEFVSGMHTNSPASSDVVMFSPTPSENSASDCDVIDLTAASALHQMQKNAVNLEEIFRLTQDERANPDIISVTQGLYGIMCGSHTIKDMVDAGFETVYLGNLAARASSYLSEACFAYGDSLGYQPATLALATLYAKNGTLNEATFPVYTRIEDLDIRMNLGVFLQEAGNLEGARTIYESVLSETSGGFDDIVLENLAEVCGLLGDDAGRLSAEAKLASKGIDSKDAFFLTQVERANPDIVAASQGLQEIMYGQKSVADMVDAGFETVYLGNLAARASSHLSEACFAYGDSLGYQPATIALATLYAKNGTLNESTFSIYRRVEDLEIRMNLGVFLQEAGNLEGARTVYENVLSETPGGYDDIVLENLAEVCGLLGDNAGQLSAKLRLLDRNPRNRALQRDVKALTA